MKCKLVIADEVNVKFVGLDLSVRKELHRKFKFEVPGARHIPAVRLGRWDGCVPFFQLSGSTYLNLLNDIIPILEKHNVVLDIEDLRKPVPDFKFTPIDENYLASRAWPKGHTHAGQPIMLRDYQVEIINKFLTNTQSVQEISTGAGKTIITATLSNIIEPYGRTLVIVPSKVLVEQTAEDYQNIGLEVGVIYGDKKEYNKSHTICTWQSLNSLLKNAEEEDDRTKIDTLLNNLVCVIGDECHTVKGEVLKKILTSEFANIPIRLGFTGTIPKEQLAREAIRCSLGEVINKVAASTLQDLGVLANCHVTILQTQETQDYKTYQAELEALVNNKDRLKWISKSVIDISKTGNTLVLCDRISTGKALQELIDESVFVNGSTKSTKRREEFNEIADVDNKVILATFGVGSTGINMPRIFNLVLIESGKSFVRVIQSIGRGIRKAKDKDYVDIWDITSSCKFSKRHLTKRKQFYTEANYSFSVKKVTY